MRIFLFIILYTPLHLNALELPAQWRFATPSEQTQSANQITIAADFNGDGKQDHAYVLKSLSYSGEGLFVYLSTETGGTWHTLERIHWGPDYPNAKLTMSIRLAEPGNYQTACGKGQWQCDAYEIAEFGTHLPGIWYIHSVGHKSMFIWNKEKQKFDKHWMSN